MRALVALSVVLAAGAAWAGQEDKAAQPPTDAEIRSGLVIDNGLDIPRIKPGTQYVDIRGSRRIERSMRRLQGQEDPVEEWLGLGPLAQGSRPN